MTGLTKEDEQKRALSTMAKHCTGNDLKMVIRLIKADLKIQAGAKHILDGLHKDAYEAFNSSRNLPKVLDKVEELREKGKPDGALDVGVTLMHPVQPMLAMVSLATFYDQPLVYLKHTVILGSITIFNKNNLI